MPNPYERSRESSEDDPSIVDIPPNDLYMDLEKILEAVRNNKDGSLYFVWDNGIIGRIRRPEISDEKEHITSREFRDRFHDIMQSFRDGDSKGYVIINSADDCQALGTIVSSVREAEDLELATKVLEAHFKPQWRKQKIEEYRSRLSRFFGRFSQKKAS